MFRQLFSAAAPSARLASPSIQNASASSKSTFAAAPAWHQPVRSPVPLYSAFQKQRNSQVHNQKKPNPRFLSTTPRTPFTTSAASCAPSPFRLTSNKNTSSSSPESAEEYYSPYKPKRQWPPDMSKLSPKHQFRLERKYRRRAALKYARPKFMKAVTLAQWVVIGCTFSPFLSPFSFFLWLGILADITFSLCVVSLTYLLEL